MKLNFLSKRNILGIGTLLLMVMPSCISTQKDEPKVDSNDYITWDVVAEGAMQGRALVENDTHLQEACSSRKAIGIWSAYELDGEVTENVLGNEYGDVALMYQVNTEWDNYMWWTYAQEASKWVYGAKYTFNAYFPMSVVNEISSSNVSTFVIEYNSERYQEDLMTAYAFVDTKAPSFRAGVPVKLKMLHTLAALKFQFSFINEDNTTFDDSDAITAFWLENTLMGRGVATTGVLAFGTIDENGVMNGEHIHWYPEYYPEPSTASNTKKIYAWEDANGVTFSSTTTGRNIAVAYSTDSDGKQKYAVNNGWILTIPQETDGTAQICFKLKNTGDLVHHVSLPTTTYEAGKRYTYDIRFSQTNVTVSLKIAAWNELKSTQDIPL